MLKEGDILTCRIVELRHKEVINNSTGCRMGFVDDIEVDTQTARVCSIIVFGRLRCCGLLGRCSDMVIPWENICLIGEDTILVKNCNPNNGKKRRKKGFFN